ncbi:hypothetical protein VMCG_10424 [Cytospora schulzeri]|uniref:Uncharacterized protein n=1 Tax=Cytospora schulzeri TaxID=448051 RepID=A0A423VBA5_9PEZI|nr:hypothetical protein VMCG_10424 [Valsa malicola]
MERRWTPQELQELIPRVLARWPGSAALLRSRGAMERLRQATRVDISTFEALPSEVVMMFAEHLAPTDIQPYLEEASMRTYKEAQNNLRNFGMVSRRMNDLVRPYLYRGIIVDNADRVVQLVRTLAKHRGGFGKHIKDLVLQVPFDETDGKFTVPDVSVFLSSQDEDLVTLAKCRVPNTRAYQALGKLYFQVVKWTMNLETLAFGMALPSSGTNSANVLYLFFWKDFCGAAGSPSYFRLPTFLPKLTTVYLHGGKSSSHRPIDSDQCRRFFDIPSVQKLVCYRDEGLWYDLRPTTEHSTPVYFRVRGATNFQFRNITTIELRESACTPLHILDICATFPCLQALSVSTSSRLAMRGPGDPSTVSDGMYLSDGLAKLPDLKTLELDLHYSHDFSRLLGPRGVLSLQPLLGLQTLRVPLHFLVLKQAEGG